MWKFTLIKFCVFIILTIKLTSEDVYAQDDGLDHLRKNIPGGDAKYCKMMIKEHIRL